jgi:hypothetical protein
MRRLAAFAMVLVVAFAAEEATQGFFLGLRPLWPLCDAIGGKHANNAFSTRCFTRLCYWIGDCGHWAAPIVWSDRVKPGDPVWKVVLWLGEPDRMEGEDLLWFTGKGSAGLIRAVIRDGRLVALERLGSQ